MNPAFRFARGGKVYKELEADQAHEIAGYIRTGIISANDDYWMPGMGDWKKVYSRQWDFPKPADDNPAPKLNIPKVTATPAATPASSGAATMQSFVKATTAYSYECATCEKGFNDPAKAVSGYSVIGNATIYFLIGIGLMVLVYAIRDAAADMLFSIDPKHGYILFSIVAGLVALVALGLFLMSGFELISAAVTHGIYRSSPLRCPHCSSSTYTRKG
jgi:DNA-directed RNA polymerase subunit RPC12/RpoP